MMWWAVPLALLSSAGLVLAALGLRGRRVGTHPTCGRCGYDLYGTLGGGRCNECGRLLTGRRAVRVGHRRRRPLLLAAGVAALLPGTLVGGAAVYVLAAGVDWQQHKPGWWLVRDLRNADETVVDAAVVELGRRGKFNLLDDPTALAGVDALLDAQGDADRPWRASWGDWIESRRAVGVVGAERMGRYYRQAFVPRLRVRAHVRRGDPLPAAVVLDLRGGSGRLGFYACWSGISYQVAGVDALAAVGVDGRAAARDAFADAASHVAAGSGTTTNAGLAFDFVKEHPSFGAAADDAAPAYLPALPADSTAALATGGHAATAKLWVWEEPAAPAAATGAAALYPQPTTAGKWVERELTATVWVDEADAPQWRVRDDADARRAMEAAVSVSTVHRQSWGGGRYQLQIFVNNLPLLANWDVELRPAAGGGGGRGGRGGGGGGGGHARRFGVPGRGVDLRQLLVRAAAVAGGGAGGRGVAAAGGAAAGPRGAAGNVGRDAGDPERPGRRRRPAIRRERPAVIRPGFG